jgi:hypothetical protein
VKNMTLFAREVLPFVRSLGSSAAAGNGQNGRAGETAPIAGAVAREGQP